MPLIYDTKSANQFTLGVWQFDEAPDFFIDKLSLTENEALILSDMTDKRAKEWLSSRHLTHLLSTRSDRAPLVKDEYGKPSIEDSTWHISISHSETMTAVIGSSHIVGIDVQKQTTKIRKIAHKFIPEDILSQLPSHFEMEHMHVHWSAKEAMYKAYGKKSLNFISHIYVDPFEFANEFSFTGKVSKNNETMHFDLKCKLIQDNYLVYAIEK